MLAAASAAIDDFAGGTRLGESLASLRRHHARRLVGGRTLVLVISDGLDTGEPEALARELDWFKRHAQPAPAVAESVAAFQRLCAAGARRGGVAPPGRMAMLAVHNLEQAAGTGRQPGAPVDETN